MEKYRLVEERREDPDFLQSTSLQQEQQQQQQPSSTTSAPINTTEVRITQQGKPRNYISYAMALLNSTTSATGHTGPTGTASAGPSGTAASAGPTGPLVAQSAAVVVEEISLKAMGRAINKAVTICEILKRKIPLHQLTTLSSCEIVDVYEPVEEGLSVVESRRFVSCIVIRLSKTGNHMDKRDKGYQPPLDSSEIYPGDHGTTTNTSGTSTTTSGSGSAVQQQQQQPLPPCASGSGGGSGMVMMLGQQQQQPPYHHHQSHHQQHGGFVS